MNITFRKHEEYSNFNPIFLVCNNSFCWRYRKVPGYGDLTNCVVSLVAGTSRFDRTEQKQNQYRQYIE
jgi:hypothetical protein